MKSALIAVMSLFTCVSAHAFELENGATLICDTQNQVERFVQLFDGNPEEALDAVNAEEQNRNACAIVDISYVQGSEVGMARSKSHAFQIVPIVVTGMGSPAGYRPVKPALFFTLVEVKEFAV